MSKGKGTTDQKLELLQSIPPLLEITLLPSPPPSPRREDHPLKRNLKETLEESKRPRIQQETSRPTPPIQRRDAIPISVDPKAWKKAWPPERLNRAQNLCLEKATELRKRGAFDAADSQTQKLCRMAYIADAACLYMFAGWVEEKKRWKEWVAFMKRLKGDVVSSPFLTALLNRLELLAAHEHLMFDLKILWRNGEQAVAGTEANSPQSHASHASSDPINRRAYSPMVSNSGALEVLKGYNSTTLNRFNIWRAYDDSCMTLSLAYLYQFPDTFRLMIDPSESDESTPSIPRKPWKFSWPIDLSRPMVIPHTVVWFRALIEEWAAQEGLDFESVQLAEL